MTPFFSIVIPTYERPQALRECLESIAGLDCPSGGFQEPFEVIVVRDGGPTPCKGVVDDFRDRLDIVLLEQENAGPAAARNRGVAEARGEYLAFVDDDCAPMPDWLAALARRLQAEPGAAVGGHTVNVLEGNPYSTASQILVDYLYSYYNAKPGQAVFLTTNNLALPRARFLELGGFDVRFRKAAAEDRDLCDRWCLRGYPLLYEPEAKMRHAHHLTLLGFWRQHCNYGRGAFEFHRQRRQRNQRTPNLEPTPFYVNLLRYARTRSQGGRAVALSLLLLLSQGAMVAGYLLEALRAKTS